MSSMLQQRLKMKLSWISNWNLKCRNHFVVEYFQLLRQNKMFKKTSNMSQSLTNIRIFILPNLRRICINAGKCILMKTCMIKMIIFIAFCICNMKNIFSIKNLPRFCLNSTWWDFSNFSIIAVKLEKKLKPNTNFWLKNLCNKIQASCKTTQDWNWFWIA